jgi:hypothetical protein
VARCWLRLTAESIEALPNAPAVFEIGNLVRTVVYIGRAEGRLRDRVTALGPLPNGLPPAVGGHYLRYELTPAEDEAITARLKTYQGRHRGSLPAGNACERAAADGAKRAA